MKTVILIIFVVVIISLFILLFFTRSKQAKKEWETLHYLEERTYKLETLEELVKFYKEFLEKASKIQNNLIHRKLHTLDGYMRGLYKVLSNKPKP